MRAPLWLLVLKSRVPDDLEQIIRIFLKMSGPDFVQRLEC
jgi:hypothetical protein